MNADEQYIADVIQKLFSKNICVDEAKQFLCVSKRTVYRYVAEFQEKDPVFIVHGNTGRKPSNKTPEDLLKRISFFKKNR